MNNNNEQPTEKLIENVSLNKENDIILIPSDDIQIITDAQKLKKERHSRAIKTTKSEARREEIRKEQAEKEAKRAMRREEVRREQAEKKAEREQRRLEKAAKEEELKKERDAKKAEREARLAEQDRREVALADLEYLDIILSQNKILVTANDTKDISVPGHATDLDGQTASYLVRMASERLNRESIQQPDIHPVKLPAISSKTAAELLELKRQRIFNTEVVKMKNLLTHDPKFDTFAILRPLVVAFSPVGYTPEKYDFITRVLIAWMWHVSYSMYVLHAENPDDVSVYDRLKLRVNPFWLNIWGDKETGKSTIVNMLCSPIPNLLKTTFSPTMLLDEERYGFAWAKNFININHELESMEKADAKKFKAVIDSTTVTYRTFFSQTRIFKPRLLRCISCSNDSLSTMQDLSSNRKMFEILINPDFKDTRIRETKLDTVLPTIDFLGAWRGINPFAPSPFADREFRKQFSEHQSQLITSDDPAISYSLAAIYEWLSADTASRSQLEKRFELPRGPKEEPTDMLGGKLKHTRSGEYKMYKSDFYNLYRAISHSQANDYHKGNKRVYSVLNALNVPDGRDMVGYFFTFTKTQFEVNELLSNTVQPIIATREVL